MNEKKRKIAIIAPGVLPIPAAKGGAVETLIEYILMENEKTPKFDFVVYTVLDKDAKAMEKEYKYTKFVHFALKSSKLNRLYSYFYRGLKQMFKIYLPYCLEYYELFRLIKRDAELYDYVLYEAGETSQIAVLNKYINKDKILVHLHWQGYWNRADMNRLNKCFNTLIPVSDYIGRGWLEHSNGTACDVDVLKNCVNVSRFEKCLDTQQINKLKNELNIATTNKVIIFIGRIIVEKGVKELIEAYIKLKNPDVSLLIVGSANFGKKTSTKYEKEVGSIISNLPEDKNVAFTGFVPHSELYRYYSIADVAVMPSRVEEAAPLVAIETQLMGVPLIATRVGGLPEYVSNEGVLLVENDDCLVDNLIRNIELLLSDAEVRNNMRRNEMKNAQKYSTQKYFEDFSKIIEGKNNGHFGKDIKYR